MCIHFTVNVWKAETLNRKKSAGSYSKMLKHVFKIYMHKHKDLYKQTDEVIWTLFTMFSWRRLFIESHLLDKFICFLVSRHKILLDPLNRFFVSWRNVLLVLRSFFLKFSEICFRCKVFRSVLLRTHHWNLRNHRQIKQIL